MSHIKDGMSHLDIMKQKIKDTKKNVKKALCLENSHIKQIEKLTHENINNMENITKIENEIHDLELKIKRIENTQIKQQTIEGCVKTTNITLNNILNNM